MKIFKYLPLFALVLAGATQSAFAQLPPLSEIQQRARSVESCFATRIGELRSTNQLSASPSPILAPIFVYDQIQKHLLSSDGRAGTFLTKPIIQFCEEQVVRPYLAAVLEVQKNKTSRRDDLAPSGTMPIESESIFIKYAQNLTGSHVRGHSDLTADALTRVGTRLLFTEQGRELIKRASQAPDFYRWTQDRYHAQTLGYLPGDRVARRNQIAASSEEFRQLVLELKKQFADHVRVGAFAEALFIVGIASHAIQDLVYHRGMTLQQHSGLSYGLVPSRNPDLPEGPAMLRRSEEAVLLTVRLIEHFVDSVGVDGKLGLSNWRPSDNFNLTALARRVFRQEGEDISVAALLEYWHLSMAYRERIRPWGELSQNDQCANQDGLACWLPSEIANSIFGKSSR